MGDKYLRDFYYWPGPGSIIVDIDTHRPSNPKSRYSESLVAFRYTDPLQLSHISKHTRRVERIKRKNSRRKNRFITTVNYFVRNCQTGKCMGTPFSARGVLIILWVVSPLLNSLCYFFWGAPVTHWEGVETQDWDWDQDVFKSNLISKYQPLILLSWLLLLYIHRSKIYACKNRYMVKRLVLGATWFHSPWFFS